MIQSLYFIKTLVLFSLLFQLCFLLPLGQLLVKCLLMHHFHLWVERILGWLKVGEFGLLWYIEVRILHAHQFLLFILWNTQSVTNYLWRRRLLLFLSSSRYLTLTFYCRFNALWTHRLVSFTWSVLFVFTQCLHSAYNVADGVFSTKATRFFTKEI